jgi:hypothetical protein
MSFRGVMNRMGIDVDGYNVDIYKGNLSARNLWSRFGDVFYVDTAVSSSGNGRSWDKAFKTLAEAQAVLTAGSLLLVKAAALNETITLGVAGVTVWGVGPTTNRCLWTAPNDSCCIKVNAVADCLIGNIRFRPAAYTSGTPKGIWLAGAANNTIIQECRFQGKAGSRFAIYTDGAQSNVHIVGNEFWYMNTLTYGHAIYGTGYADGEPSGWIIERNKFHSNLNHIVCRMRQSMILHNVLPAGGLEAAGSMNATMTVLGIDIHGAVGGINQVQQNKLGGLYHQAHYYGGTDDDWSGNYCTDRSHATQVDATTGFSILPPAA